LILILLNNPIYQRRIWFRNTNTNTATNSNSNTTNSWVIFHLHFLLSFLSF